MEENKNIEKETIVIDNTDNVIGWLEKFLRLMKEYGPVKILFSALLISIITTFFYFVFNPTKVFELYDEWKARQHTELMDLRLQTAPKIQTLVDKLTFQVGASRTLVLEMHNGSTGTGGLPFTKCTATYEGLNIWTQSVASQYQEQNLSLIPFATHLFKQGYWCGDTEELLSLDRGLYYKMKSNNTEHFAACVIEGIDNKAIAFLIVSFDKVPGVEMTAHDCATVRENIRHVAMELAVLLEVSRLIQ